jgi:hypothetical protein
MFDDVPLKNIDVDPHSRAEYVRLSDACTDQGSVQLLLDVEAILQDHIYWIVYFSTYARSRRGAKTSEGLTRPGRDLLARNTYE